MITEVYVSEDNIEFTKLDLFKDEAINIKRTQKDLQDLSKIFSPYSLNFSFKATPKNRQAFGFFGETSVIKINTENKYFCKIYTNGMLTFKGFISLKSINYKNNTANNFIGSFSTSFSDLKTKIGEDLIQDLGFFNVNWTPKKVFELLQGSDNGNVNGVNLSYFVPLVSNNRVWSYDVTDTALDNVRYNPNRNATDYNLIRSNELKPCISFSTIIELIIKKYNLSVNAPLFSRPEYKDLVIYCNNEKIVSSLEKQLKLISPFGLFNWSDPSFNFPPAYYATLFSFDNSITIQQIPYSTPPSFVNLIYQQAASFTVYFQNVSVTSDSIEAPKVTIRLKRKLNNELLLIKPFELDNGNDFICGFDIPNSLFIGGILDFYITAEFNVPLQWTNNYFECSTKYVGTASVPGNTFYFSNVVSQYSFINNNSLDFGATNLDLMKMLPNIKVVDFLSSFFKTFNISVYEDSIENTALSWLTPEDIQTNGLPYSKAKLDYTPYVDITSVTKSTSLDYNYFDLKHIKSKYKSNTDYKEANGVEYAEAVYPIIKPDKPIPFIVQTSFSIIPPVKILGTNTPTFYAFTKDKPSILTGGQSRYKPNYNECTLFYNHGIKNLPLPFGVQSQNLAGTFTNEKLQTFNKVMPFSKYNHSLAFSNIVFDSIEYADSLFLKYYSKQIIRLLDPNVLTQDFTLKLPSSEIYTNEATTIQGGGQTPIGFRLQNEIIIGETLYTIIDSVIDITTGKTKLTLLNF